MKFLIILLIMAVGCGTDDPFPEVESPTAPAEKVHPTLTLHLPEHGTFSDGPIALLSGFVDEGSAPLSELTINGEIVPFDGGTFQYQAHLEPGPNIFGLRLTAEDDGRAVEAVTVYGPSTHPPGALLPSAMLVQISQEALDNDSQRLDSVAGIVEALLANQQFLDSFVSEPFEIAEDSFITVERIAISDAQVEIRAGSGCLTFDFLIGATSRTPDGNLEIDLQASGSSAILGETIMLRSTSARLEGQLCPINEGEVSFEIREPDVTFTGFALSTNEYPNLAEDLPSVNNALRAAAESAMEMWVGESLAELVLDMLREFGSDYQFGPLEAEFGLESALVDASGLRMSFSVRFSAQPGIASIPSGAGSLRTDDPALQGSFSEAPIALALSDDAMNQLAFAVWYSGQAEDFETDPAALAALPAVFQPLTDLQVRIFSPPAFVAPTEEGFAFDIVAGGIAVDFISQDRRFDSVIHFRAGVRVDTSEDDLSLRFDNRAQRINVQTSVSTAPPEHEIGDIAALLRLMVPPILGTLNVGFEGFPLPSLNLAELGEGLAGFAGREIAFSPQNVDRHGEGGGYLIVEGRLAERAGMPAE